MRYRILGHSGLRVSELALGTMTFGEAWGWGASREESRRLLDAFSAQGGNYIDTAGNYTDGEAEEIVGELLEGRRDSFVLATKYTLTSSPSDPNGGGNHRKSLVRSLERSLRRLRTDCVDLLWLHMWDGLTPVEEVVCALDDAVRSGKVLHVGFSDTPAWVIARATAVAEGRGWSRCTAVQAPYSLAARDVERDLLPMARDQNQAVVVWGTLAGGVLTGKYADGAGAASRRYGDAPVGERRARLAQVVQEVARELGCSPAQLSLAWVLAQRTRANVIPILGARSAAQLQENLRSLDLQLEGQTLDRLAAASGFQAGFPADFLADPEVVSLIFGATRPLIDA